LDRTKLDINALSKEVIAGGTLDRYTRVSSGFPIAENRAAAPAQAHNPETSLRTKAVFLMSSWAPRAFWKLELVEVE
jgi:hypothetical protein